MAHLTITEDGIASLREEVARRMEATKQFSPEIAQEFAKLLTSAGPNLDQHGVALWHFMQKETPGGGVNAKKLGVYLQYYYLTTLSYSRARPFSRHLTTVDLCFLIAIASAGFERGRGMFDEVLERRAEWSAIQSLMVTREAFLQFFYAPPGEQRFSFTNCLHIMDKLWSAWDKVEPKIIHGFITPNFSKKCLEARRHKPGSFMLRFDSKGGLSIDYLKDDGSLDSGKVLPDALVTPRALCAVVQQAPALKGLIDSRADLSSDATLGKELLLPMCDGTATIPPVSGVALAPAVAAAPMPAAAPTSPAVAQPAVNTFNTLNSAVPAFGGAQPAPAIPAGLAGAPAASSSAPAFLMSNPIDEKPVTAPAQPKDESAKSKSMAKKDAPEKKPKKNPKKRPHEDDEDEEDDEDDEDDEGYEDEDEESDEDGSDEDNEDEDDDE